MSGSIKNRINAFIGEENLEFFRHTRNYLSGTVVSNILVVASLPILTHFLDPDEYGILSIFFTVSSVFVIAFGLNINAGITRYYLEKKDDFAGMLGTNLLFIGGFSLLLLAAVHLFRAPLAHLVGVDETVFWYGSLLAILSVAIEIYMPLLNAAQKSRAYAALTVLKTGAALGLSIGLILYLREDRYLGRVFGELIVVGLLSLYAVFAMGTMSSWRFSRAHLFYALAFSLPLLPHTISRFVLGWFDRILIFNIVDENATGLYSFAYDVGMAMNLIVLATVRAWRPIFFEEYRQQNLDRINRMARHYALDIYFIAFVIILFAQEAVTLVADEKFAPAFPLIPVIILGYVFVFLYTLYFQYAAFDRRTGLISVNTVIAGAANVGLNWWLIPIFGYAAAAWTSLFSFALLYVLHYLNARFVLKAAVIPPGAVLPRMGLLLAATAAVMAGGAVITVWWILLPLKALLLVLGIRYYYGCRRRAV